MYIPPAFKVDDRSELIAMINAVPLAQLVTATEDGLMATPLPLQLDASEGPHGVLYGHVAKANPQWRSQPVGEAMAIFMGPDAYVSPSWYPTKQETGKVVPTWNYTAVHAYGAVEFFEDADRLLALVSRLTDHHEKPRAKPWAVSDAPESYIQSQLRGIVGVKLTISRIEGKRKLSQNRNAADHRGVIDGLESSYSEKDHATRALMLQTKPNT
jgi:transcriptional regulator